MGMFQMPSFKPTGLIDALARSASGASMGSRNVKKRRALYEQEANKMLDWKNKQQVLQQNRVDLATHKSNLGLRNDKSLLEKLRKMKLFGQQIN